MHAVCMQHIDPVHGPMGVFPDRSGLVFGRIGIISRIPRSEDFHNGKCGQFPGQLISHLQYTELLSMLASNSLGSGLVTQID